MLPVIAVWEVCTVKFMFFKNLYSGDRWYAASVIFNQSKSLLHVLTQLIGVFIGPVKD